MKIYTKIKIDMETGRTVEEESFEYSGPVALCIGPLAIVTAGVGIASFLKSMQDKKSSSGDIPAHLTQFWDEFVQSWFGEDGGKFKNMILENISYQEDVYKTFLGETGGYTTEYRDKLENLESTYTNRPYTFNFKIMGQTVKNIPKRSLSTIQTLGELASKRYGAGMGQSKLKMAGGMQFTPNKGQEEYMKMLMQFLQKAPGYQQPQKQEKDFLDILGQLTKIGGEVAPLFA